MNYYKNIFLMKFLVRTLNKNCPNLPEVSTSLQYAWITDTHRNIHTDTYTNTQTDRYSLTLRKGVKTRDIVLHRGVLLLIVVTFGNLCYIHIYICV